MNKAKTTWAQLHEVTMQDQSMDTWYCLSLSFFQLVQFRWHKFMHEVADAAKLPLHSWRRSSPSLRLLLRSAKKALTTQRCRTIHRCLCISLVLQCIPVRMQSRLYTDRLANAWYAFGNYISIYIQYTVRMFESYSTERDIGRAASNFWFAIAWNRTLTQPQQQTFASRW